MTALLNLIYCVLMDMIASFKDLWLVGWDSILAPVDALLASVGTGGLAVPAIADQYAWLLGATGMSQAIAIDRRSDGGPIPAAVGALCAVGVLMRAVTTHSFKLIQAEDALLRGVARATGLTFSDVVRVGLYRLACAEGLVELATRAMAERVEHLSDCQALWERSERD